MIGSGRDQLVVRLLFVGRHLLDLAAREIAREGKALTVVETAALLALRAFPAMVQTDLASILMRDKTTLSRTLARLEEEGYISARIDPIDGRRRALDLTDKASRLVAPALESITDRLERAAAGMTEQEGKAFVLLIELLMEDVSVV